MLFFTVRGINVGGPDEGGIGQSGRNRPLLPKEKRCSKNAKGVAGGYAKGVTDRYESWETCFIKEKEGRDRAVWVQQVFAS